MISQLYKTMTYVLNMWNTYVLTLLGLVCSSLTNEPLQLSLSYESFYLLFQIVAIGCMMSVVMVEAIVLIPWHLAGISFQFTGKHQRFFVFNLYQDLIDQGSQGGETCELPSGGLRTSVFPPFSSPSHFSPPILPGIFLFFPLSRFVLSGYSASSAFMYLVAL